MHVQNEPSNDDVSSIAGADCPQVGLPLVSIIIVNYNYGHFLKSATDSVFGQTYRNVECVLVDNASTDISSAVITELEASYPDLKVIRRTENDGQTPASLDGFQISSGQYVIFMDADDLLLPRCIETHIFCLLSTRVHVGFSSGDMLQVVNDHIVLSSGEVFGDYVRSGRGRRRRMIRPYRHAYAPAWPDADWAAETAARIHYVPPLTAKWLWSPTSGNCFRRDAVAMFADSPALAALRTGTDMYFAHGIGALSGSILIDEPLFAYRIHGGNVFSRTPQLNRTLCYRPGSIGDSNAQAQLILIDHLIDKADRFAANFILKINFACMLILLDRSDPSAQLAFWRRRSRAAARLADEANLASSNLGPLFTALLMFFFGTPLSIVLRTASGRRP